MGCSVLKCDSTRWTGRVSQPTQCLEGTKMRFYAKAKEFKSGKRVGKRLSLGQVGDKNI